MSKFLIVSNVPAVIQEYQDVLGAQGLGDELLASLNQSNVGLFHYSSGVGHLGKVKADAHLVANYAREHGFQTVFSDVPEANGALFRDVLSSGMLTVVRTTHTTPEFVARQPMLASMVRGRLMLNEQHDEQGGGAYLYSSAQSLVRDYGGERREAVASPKGALAQIRFVFDNEINYAKTFGLNKSVVRAVLRERFESYDCKVAGAALAEMTLDADIANQVLRLPDASPATVYLIAAEHTKDAKIAIDLYEKSGDPVGLSKAAFKQFEELGKLGGQDAINRYWRSEQSKEQLVDAIAVNVRKSVKGFTKALRGDGFCGDPLTQGGIILEFSEFTTGTGFAEHPVYKPNEVLEAAQVIHLIAREQGLVDASELEALQSSIQEYQYQRPDVKAQENTLFGNSNTLSFGQ